MLQHHQGQRLWKGERKRVREGIQVILASPPPLDTAQGVCTHTAPISLNIKCLTTCQSPVCSTRTRTGSGSVPRSAGTTTQGRQHMLLTQEGSRHTWNYTEIWPGRINTHKWGHRWVYRKGSCFFRKQKIGPYSKGHSSLHPLRTQFAFS